MPCYSDLNDQKLISLIKEGDKAAFTVIYDRYWRLLYSHLYKMIRDEEEAKDILQELFAKLWTQSDKIPEQQNFAGYLYVAVRRKVLNAIRRNAFCTDYLISLEKHLEAGRDVTSEYLAERDLRVALEREVNALPPRMRQAYEMSRKHNLSYKEIGRQLGTSEETVKKQIGKSLKVIRYNLRSYQTIIILVLSIFR